MRIKSQFILLASATGVAMAGLVGSVWGYARAAGDVTSAYDQKYRSYMLADNFRQSSDDLTRLVRTYAETSDTSFKDQYNAVVEIRNGTRARPSDYHRIYWDFVAGGEIKPRPDGPAVSMHDLMKQAGFTDEEFALLDEAGKRSDALITLETEAMALVDNAAKLGPEATRKATQMLNSPDYHKFKAEIMKPVDAFYVKLDRRTQGAVDEANVRASFYWILMMVAMSALAVMLIVVGFVTFRRIIGGMYNLGKSMGLVADGHLDTQIGLAANDDEIGDMGKALEVFRQASIANRRLEQEAMENRKRAEVERVAMQEKAEADAEERLRVATSGLAAGLKRLASGDLAFQLNNAFAQDFEALRHDFNQSVAQLGSTLSEISGSISTLDTGTREIAVGTDDLSKRTEQQAASLEETAAALDQITVNVANSSKRTEEAKDVASRANHSAAESAYVVSNAEEAMRKIEESSEQISNIIGVIDEIAFQTNLLALNAGVEAARAGEAGKGFAVVAQEVRELAQRSAQAAKEIKGLIRNSSLEVNNGVKLVRDAGSALKTISDFIVEINAHMEAIATSAKEQAVGLAEVNTAVNAMDQMTQQNAAMVEQSNAASNTLANEAVRLQELVSQFKLGRTGGSQMTAVNHGRRDFANTSVARTSVRNIASAFSGNAALDIKGDWQEF
ncbi:methyl-accepting chemotaxis protein [Ensifer adhaerens]|uniref:methyl-accepting chemotaxis protein n=1 Tax=Ensifer adhaerens TaxID=106592 RepID=UPI001CBB3930|nr:methyl-accepting chemotaxis protein [Ensifer adhaerens]MBZ7927739.1 methyl-accepting chemotaxis protein [Ensifer adhaerens]